MFVIANTSKNSEKSIIKGWLRLMHSRLLKPSKNGIFKKAHLPAHIQQSGCIQDVTNK